MKPRHFVLALAAVFLALAGGVVLGARVLTDPMVLNRPEDKLDMPGILEDSMERGASCPHAEWTERRAS